MLLGLVDGVNSVDPLLFAITFDDMKLFGVVDKVKVIMVSEPDVPRMCWAAEVARAFVDAIILIFGLLVRDW